MGLKSRKGGGACRLCCSVLVALLVRVVLAALDGDAHILGEGLGAGDVDWATACVARLLEGLTRALLADEGDLLLLGLLDVAGLGAVVHRGLREADLAVLLHHLGHLDRLHLATSAEQKCFSFVFEVKIWFVFIVSVKHTFCQNFKSEK
jgi:hypothetical protein